jgi:hypothetical protein
MSSVSYEIQAAKGTKIGLNAKMLIQKLGSGTAVIAGNLSRIG